jgi:hypothetical protein
VERALRLFPWLLAGFTDDRARVVEIATLRTIPFAVGLGSARADDKPDIPCDQGDPDPCDGHKRERACAPGQQEQSSILNEHVAGHGNGPHDDRGSSAPASQCGDSGDGDDQADNLKHADSPLTLFARKHDT